MSALTSLEIEAAAERLAGVAHVTPVLTSTTVNALTGREVFFKAENFQRCGAFKFRGAYNTLAQLGSSERAAGVITHSSGNHGQAVALASRLLGIRAVVVMPEDSARVKREAVEGYGAEVVACPGADREKVTSRLIAETGRTLVHPYDDDRIIAGQGTAARELFEEAGELNLLLVPVGGGGLLGGSALAAAAHAPRCRVIGVEPERAADAARSLREGRIHTLAVVPDTVADGLRPRAIGERNFAVIRRHVTDIVTVGEREILAAMRFIWERMKIVVEPSAAVALAPLLGGSRLPRGAKVGVILSGGNVDVASIAGKLAAL